MNPSLSFLTNLGFGYASYFTDVITDIIFAGHLFNQINRNFAGESSICSLEFKQQFVNVSEICSTVSNDCIANLRILAKGGENCLAKSNRFDSGSNEWLFAGIVAAIHCGLPVLFAFLIWLFGIVGIVKESVDKITWNKYERNSRELLLTRIGRVLSKLNIPIFTKLYAFISDVRLFKMMRTDPKYRDNYWTSVKADIEKELEENQFSINISMIAEAALESGFQVNFCTNIIIQHLKSNISVLVSNNISDANNCNRPYGYRGFWWW